MTARLRTLIGKRVVVTFQDGRRRPVLGGTVLRVATSGAYVLVKTPDLPLRYGERRADLREPVHVPTDRILKVERF